MLDNSKINYKKEREKLQLYMKSHSTIYFRVFHFSTQNKSLLYHQIGISFNSKKRDISPFLLDIFTSFYKSKILTMSLDYSYLQNIVIIDGPIEGDDYKEQQELTAQGIVIQNYSYIALKNEVVSNVLTSPFLESVVMNSILFT